MALEESFSPNSSFCFNLEFLEVLKSSFQVSSASCAWQSCRTSCSWRRPGTSRFRKKTVCLFWGGSDSPTESWSKTFGRFFSLGKVMENGGFHVRLPVGLLVNLLVIFGMIPFPRSEKSPPLFLWFLICGFIPYQVFLVLVRWDFSANFPQKMPFKSEKNV